jgi:ribosomal protein L12E/L44/L45/RPP1/RPP2
MEGLLQKATAVAAAAAAAAAAAMPKHDAKPSDECATLQCNLAVAPAA